MIFGKVQLGLLLNGVEDGKCYIILQEDFLLLSLFLLMVCVIYIYIYIFSDV